MCQPCGQAVVDFMRWLNAHWRAAHVICLYLKRHRSTSFSHVVDWEAPASAPGPGSARVLRVGCDGPFEKRDETWRMRRTLGDGSNLGLELPRWVAGVAPLCQNLVTLHLRGMEVKPLPALPLLMHVILERCIFTPALVTSLQGLARLETLHVSGSWDQGLSVSVWDVRACPRLRRIYMGLGLANGLAKTGQELRLPPACTVALEFQQVAIEHSEKWRRWLLPLGWRITNLHLRGFNRDVPDLGATFVQVPQLSQLRHVMLSIMRVTLDCKCVATLLGGLPQSVESLHLDYPALLSGEAVVVVPASLRALCIKSVCTEKGCRTRCICPPSQRTQDLTFGLHAGLARLCLVLWDVRTSLQCLDAGAPASLREVDVQAQAVHLNPPLAAEVAQRGHVLERCIKLDWSWPPGSGRPPVQVVHMGQGPVPAVITSGSDWACTCGTCAECLGPEAFGGVKDAWR